MLRITEVSLNVNKTMYQPFFILLEMLQNFPFPVIFTFYIFHCIVIVGLFLLRHLANLLQGRANLPIYCTLFLFSLV